MSAVARRYYLRGRAALDRGDLEVAVEGLSAAVDLVPTFVDARLAYAVALARLGDCPRAARVLHAGLGRRAGPRARALLFLTLADVLTQAGDYPGAENALRQAAEHPAFADRAAGALARVHAKTGRFAESFAELARAARGSAPAGD